MSSTATLDQQPDDSPSYWRSPRTATAALVLVCVAATVLWTTTTGGQHQTAAPTGYESACGLTGGSTDAPTQAPAVQWQNIDGNWLPVSTTQGPGRRPATGPWSCYAHTPTGAVLAAWGIPAGWTPANFASAVPQQTVPGPGRAALLKQGPGDTPANQRPTPTGFRINAYDGQSATVTFYMRQRGTNVSCASTVQWVGADKGDWALRPAADGSDVSACQILPADLRGLDFVMWGPNA